MPHNMFQNIASVLSVNHRHPQPVESWRQEARLDLVSEEEHLLPSSHIYHQESKEVSGG